MEKVTSPKKSKFQMESKQFIVADVDDAANDDDDDDVKIAQAPIVNTNMA